MPHTTGADAAPTHLATPIHAALMQRVGPMLNDPQFPAAAWESLVPHTAPRR